MFTFSKHIGSIFLYTRYFSLFLCHYFKKHNKMLSLASAKDQSSERCISRSIYIKCKLASDNTQFPLSPRKNIPEIGGEKGTILK